ncbi:DUF4389 domain-containing protein [Pseudarthrobacter sp. H2]|uniref:DUF4389 domain-containing protein n=1 Tax=Pseudarthrobacter sp. H2 TaxID=3418415 RepID=UPI003CF6FCB0
MRPGRIVMLVLGTLSALLGLGLLAGAGAAGWANYQQRDGGYFTSPLERFSADSYALNSPRLDVMTGGGMPDAGPVDLAGSVMLRGSAADPAKAVFIGIAPRSDVEAYLTGVKHSEIVDVRFDPFRTQYREVSGTKAPARPADQAFWTASATGPGTQQLKWDLRSGTWAVVIMNADASSPVAVDLQAGARSELLWPIFLGLLISGIVFLLIGLPLIVVGAAGLGRGGPPSSRPGHPAQGYGTPAYAGEPGQPYPAQPGQPYAAQPGQPYAVQPYAAAYPGPGQQARGSVPPGTAARPYPARLSGYLDPNLSRWMWLVKWFLAIPHVVVLFFLWFAFIVTTIVAWFAILFTGRYPRSLFDFNVGVIRWNWRVAFYSYGVLGTDLYPPFTLARTDYPADFDVEYPERLSRGLVLVKSWLLAIPHLLIVGVLTGTARTWTARDGEWVRESFGISLIGLLVLIAGFILLFTGQYWRGLFDLLLGLQRWIYRVIAYVSLMRDEYPPFQLDLGPADPGDVPALASAGQPYAAPPAGGTPHAVPGGPGTPPEFYGAGGPPVSEGPGRPAGQGPPPGTDKPGRAGPGRPADLDSET